MTMKKGKCDGATECPMHTLLQTLARPWTMHILWVLSQEGPTRFGALRRKVEGISSRVLTERLRALEDRGFVYRQYEASIPPAVTYGLTKRVKEFQHVLCQLNEVARKWQEEDASAARTATSAENPAPEAVRPS
jgi:DNA-binding HxlR family transcriptional regulator